MVAAEAREEVVAEVGMAAGLINRIERNGLAMTKEELLTSMFEVFVSLQIYKIAKSLTAVNLKIVIAPKNSAPMGKALRKTK